MSTRKEVDSKVGGEIRAGERHTYENDTTSGMSGMAQIKYVGFLSGRERWAYRCRSGETLREGAKNAVTVYGEKGAKGQAVCRIVGTGES